MRDPSEVLRGPFDIETHKGTFVHYLEVCIDRDGIIPVSYTHLTLPTN